jgi:hypothetical protein
MTQRDNGWPMTKDYKIFCYEFFLKQLEFIKPVLVLCLGKDIDTALREDWVDKILFSKYKFEFIPHPSFAHINWKEPIKEKIKSTINDHQPRQRMGSDKGMFILKPGWDDPLDEVFKDYM